MKKRMILLLVLLALAALVAGTATIYYAISARQLAKRQSAFRARGSASLQRVSGFFHSLADSDPTKTTSTLATSRDAASPSSTTQAAALRPSSTRVHRAPASPATFRRGLDQLALELNEYTQSFYNLPRPWPVWLTVEVNADELDSRGTLAAAGFQKLNGECRKQLAEMERARRVVDSQKAVKNRLGELDRELSRIPLFDFMARVEGALLAGDWTPPDATDFFKSAYGGDLYCLKMLAELALLQAALRGEGARAGRLLLKDLEYRRSRYLAAYPKNGDVLNLDFPQTIFTLNELTPIADETLAQAARLLASMQPTPAQATYLRQAHALRWFDFALRPGSQASLSEVPMGYNQNYLHFFQIDGAGLDTLLYRLNRPKMIQHLQEYAEAWAASQREAMKTAERKLASLARLCNMDTDNLRRALLYEIDDAGDTRAQGSLDLARLTLAAMRYRHATGQFPASDADLGTHDLDPPLHATTTTWHLARLDAFEVALSRGVIASFPARPAFYSAHPVRRMEIDMLGAKDYRDRPPDWEPDGNTRILLQHGYRERLIWRLDVVIPQFPDAWREELEWIKHIGAPAAPATPAVPPNSAKNLSNQTTATALKK